jgi:RsmE family RNA methyltransferase
VRDLLDKNVSPEVAAHLVRDGAALGGEEREVTILFSDLRGFTTMSEQFSPHDLLTLLNRYLDRMSAEIERHGGVIDKFIGDKVMGVFSGPARAAALQAVRAGLGIQARLRALNQARPSGKRPLTVGIGINTGVATVGTIGSSERMDFTVRKSVELGVTAIHQLAASRSVVRLDAERERKRVAHWQAVAIAACEQCGRNRIPAVAAPATLADWLAPKQGRDAVALRVLLSPRGAARLRDLPRPAGAVELLAGPEGGFTPEEEALARGSGFTPGLLGPRVLRTETAAVAGLAAIQGLGGDFLL